MLKSSVCDHSDAHILVKGTTTVIVQVADAAAIAAGRNDVLHKLTIPKILML